LEVLFEFFMVDTQEGHALIEIFRFLVERQSHSFGVHKKFVGVSFLFLDLKHLLLSKSCLLSLKTFLGSTSFLLTLLVFFFLKLVLLGLFLHTDWYWFEFTLVNIGDILDWVMKTGVFSLFFTVFEF